MGYQVIKQPNGGLGIFSGYVDDWIVCDATPEEIIEWCEKDAAESAARHARMELEIRILPAVLSDQPRKAYFQFAMTYDEAEALAVEVHGNSRDTSWRHSEPTYGPDV
jgi:hypothetical protein